MSERGRNLLPQSGVYALIGDEEKNGKREKEEKETGSGNPTIRSHLTTRMDHSDPNDCEENLLP